jgi:AcrR family transcriptional regulator
MSKRKTRELILETSLALFNDLGEPNVTTNHIADEAGISPGNLYYHFHSKQDIVVELFKRFAVQIEPLIDVPPSAALHAEDLWLQLHLSFEIKGHYRFLYRNFADIAGRMPQLGRAFRGLFLRERRAASGLISSLEQQGLMHIDDAEKGLLLDNLMLALIYWIPFAELFEQGGLESDSAQVKAIAGVLQMIMPYLAAPEHAQFAGLVAGYLEHLGPG